MKRRAVLQLLTVWSLSTPLARFNEILVGRFNRALQKLSAIKGEVPAPQMASEIMPVFPIPLDVDFRYLESKHTFASANTQNGVAAQFGFVQLFNPTKSGILVVVTKAWCLPKLVADQPYFGFQANSSALGSVSSSVRLDARIGTNALPSATSNTGTVASFGSNVRLGQAQLTATSDRMIDFILTDATHVPVLPGDSVFIASNVVNTAFSAGFIWHERPLDEAEQS